MVGTTATAQENNDDDSLTPDRPLSSSEKSLAADNFGIGVLLSRYLGREKHTFVMAEYEQQNMPYRSYNVKLKDALLQVGYMHPILSDKGKNTFLYGGISALGGNDNGTVFKTNDRYPPTKDVFRLCTPNCYPTARRLMYMWRIVSVRFSSLPLVSTTSVRIARISLHLHATKNVIDASDKFFHFTLCILPILSA